MDQNLIADGFIETAVNMIIPMRKTINGEKIKKCSQCKYAFSNSSHLRRHFKTHSGEKSNKCNQCDYASSQAGHLRIHLKTHSGEKSNKCNQCDYASSQASHLRTPLGKVYNKHMAPSVPVPSLFASDIG